MRHALTISLLAQNKGISTRVPQFWQTLPEHEKEKKKFKFKKILTKFFDSGTSSSGNWWHPNTEEDGERCYTVEFALNS